MIRCLQGPLQAQFRESEIMDEQYLTDSVTTVALLIVCYTQLERLCSRGSICYPSAIIIISSIKTIIVSTIISTVCDCFLLYHLFFLTVLYFVKIATSRNRTGQVKNGQRKYHSCLGVLKGLYEICLSLLSVHLARALLDTAVAT